MGNFIQMIGNFLQSIADLLVNFISGIFQMFGMVFVSTGFLSNILAYMPAVISVVVTAIISINVVYLIIGR